MPEVQLNHYNQQACHRICYYPQICLLWYPCNSEPSKRTVQDMWAFCWFSKLLGSFFYSISPLIFHLQNSCLYRLFLPVDVCIRQVPSCQFKSTCWTTRWTTSERNLIGLDTCSAKLSFCCDQRDHFLQKIGSLSQMFSTTRANSPVWFSRCKSAP